MSKVDLPDSLTTAAWEKQKKELAKDKAVLAKMAGWGWQDGLKPGPLAPVTRMDTFRDQFLTTFSQ